MIEIFQIINEGILKKITEIILSNSDEDNLRIYNELRNLSKLSICGFNHFINSELCRIYYFLFNRFGGDKNIFKLGFDQEKDLEIRSISEEEFINNIEYYMDLVDEGFIYKITSYQESNKEVIIMPSILYDIYNNIENLVKENKW